MRVVARTIRNMGNWAVKVHGGAGHGVVGCDIYQTGQGGVHLEGGDRKTLTPASHYADNNHIHHTARWDPVYQQTITVFGVDPRFAGKPPADFSLAKDSPAWKLGFCPIPRDKMGVYQSDDRASWPVEHTVRSAPTTSMSVPPESLP